MALSEKLQTRLSKTYPPSSMVELKYNGKDVMFKTDHEGNAIILFIGEVQADGKIKGERYSRTIVRSIDGKILKDHWDRKGKT